MVVDILEAQKAFKCLSSMTNEVFVKETFAILNSFSIEYIKFYMSYNKKVKVANVENRKNNWGA